MALALENALYAKQKVDIALSQQNAHPMVKAQLDALFSHFAQKGNPDLQFVAYDGTDAEGANGYNSGIAAACTVYAVYGKKPRIAEDVFLAVLDDASGAEGTAIVTSIGFLAKNGTTTTLPQEEVLLINTTGYPIANGVNIKAYTTAAGTTDTTAGAAPDGFFLVGA